MFSNREGGDTLGEMGGSDAFENFFRKNAQFAARVLYKNYPNIDKGSVEDIIQEGMMAMCKLGKKFYEIPDERRRAYLVVAVCNKAKDYLARCAREGKVACWAESPSQDDGSSFEDVHVRDVVDRLPEELREIVLLVWVHDLAIGDVAAAKGVSRRTISTRLSEAREKIREGLLVDDGQMSSSFCVTGGRV